jgi:hypothetical protein
VLYGDQPILGVLCGGISNADTLGLSAEHALRHGVETDHRRLAGRNEPGDLRTGPDLKSKPFHVGEADEDLTDAGNGARANRELALRIDDRPAARVLLRSSTWFQQASRSDSLAYVASARDIACRFSAGL